MRRIKKLLEQKGGNVYTIGKDASVYDAIALMSKNNVGALVVTTSGEQSAQVIGVVTERDYLNHVVLKGRTSRETPVAEIMSRKVIYGEPDQSVEDILAIMTKQRIRHVPVISGEKLLGIVSIGDCAKEVIEKKDIEIKYLKDYLSDSYPA